MAAVGACSSATVDAAFDRDMTAGTRYGQAVAAAAMVTGVISTLDVERYVDESGFEGFYSTVSNSNRGIIDDE
ncbi:hypothetical protein Aduo_010395 [Ancylostoma duodenale]